MDDYRPTIDDQWQKVSSAINKVAGCSMLSWGSNPDLKRLVIELQDESFKMDRVLEDE